MLLSKGSSTKNCTKPCFRLRFLYTFRYMTNHAAGTARVRHDLSVIYAAKRSLIQVQRNECQCPLSAHCGSFAITSAFFRRLGQQRLA